MIDRSYLPFKSARDYQDVKMQKWMGFFLSEHHAALLEDSDKKHSRSDLTTEQKHLLLSQIYANQWPACIEVSEKKACISYTGTIAQMTPLAILLKTQTGYYNLPLEAINRIALAEEVAHESA
ncbi:hypothetical protein [Streptococcus sp. DD12]|uniref:hypothetical protein n=1 Tax=Streptococcus sp. DD12 TaxID=1777880 RepID=UPI0007914484|nr:hypothetical protein [Streptococcus sp. DD12]KXT77033.1 hypothetical protein STRDD12_00167 [Streptococcus sp. DD12]